MPSNVYNEVSSRISISYPNSASEIYDYDAVDRLIRKETYDGQGALVQSYDDRDQIRSHIKAALDGGGFPNGKDIPFYKQAIF